MSTAPMDDTVRNLTSIRQRINEACRVAGRDPSGVRLVAVTKTFPVEAIRAAFDAGQRVFGESRLQEAMPKIDALSNDISWHFIGRVQRNKLRKILAAFDVVHGMDSLGLAQAADRMASELGLSPQIFLQVNLGGEETKGGFAPDELMDLMPALRELARLDIRGLMAIPPPAESEEQARRMFAALRTLRDRLQAAHSIDLPDLSMGMSDDFEAAIHEGATHVRVGSAIFGNRTFSTPPARA